MCCIFTQEKLLSAYTTCNMTKKIGSVICKKMTALMYETFYPSESKQCSMLMLKNILIQPSPAIETKPQSFCFPCYIQVNTAWAIEN